MRESQARAILLEAGASPERVTDFLRYHNGNPSVWQQFVIKAGHYIDEGAKRLSAKRIWEDLRADANLRTNGKSWKLPNEWHSFYAHIFCARYPQFRNLFVTKGLK